MALENLTHFIGGHFLINDRFTTADFNRYVGLFFTMTDAPGTGNLNILPVRA
jgi:hypothetical protein